MSEFTIAGVGGAVLVGLLVQALKATIPGFAESRWVLVAALALGIALAVAARLSGLLPSVQAWLEIGVMGLMAGFTAAGLYDAASTGAARVREALLK